MPYRRRYKRGYGRRRRRYNPYRRGNPLTYGAIAKKVLNDVSWLKGKVSLLNTEVKRHDFSSFGTIQQFSGTATFVPLTNIAQGDSEVTRDGNSLKATSLHIRVGLGQAATAAEQRIRIMVCQLKKAGEAPTITDVLETPAANLDSWRNIDKSRDLKMLSDKTYSMPADGQTSERHIQYNFKISHHIKFDNTNDNSQQYGAIGICIMTDEPTNRAGFNLASRFRYVDN